MCFFRIAGSETTATALATAMYNLLNNQGALKLLLEEVRGSFASAADINAQSTSSLRYLQAVCSECLRMFPPLPLGLPRIVPKGGDMVDGVFVPEDVS